MILIKDGRVIDPRSGRDELLDIVVENGRVRSIGKFHRSEEYEKIINAKGLIVAPGLVDVHVHFRDPGFPEKEDIISGARAGARGGFTSVVMMANTKPVIDNEMVLNDVLDKCKKADIHVYANATITKGMNGQELVDMKALKQAGAIGFSDDGKPIMDSGLIEQAMKQAVSLNVPLSFHEEDPSFISTAGVNDGEASKKLGLQGAKALAEDVMVARDVMIALHTGSHINIQHISSANSVELVRMAKRLGADISAEATPHHVTLDESAVENYGTLAKMNPPLRKASDRYAIIEGLKDGTIDIIATDHAPHTKEEKEREFAKAPSGIIGLETSLSLGITSLVRKGILTMLTLMEKMSYHPALLYHLDAGYIDEGGPADFVIFDERKKVTYDHFVSKSSNSPFTDMELYGDVIFTICEGNIVYAQSEERVEAPL